MEGFVDKVILVTGANSGIGRATAVKLAKLGASVVCVGRRQERGEEVLTEVREHSSGRGHFIQCDISDVDAVDQLFAFISGEFGVLDGAFNNAGIEAPLALLPEISIETFDSVHSVNLRGTFLCMRHELAMMMDRGCGSVVNTSSEGGVRGIGSAAAYTASKHGVVGMTKAAALDMGIYGVRVNCICPGATDTEMMDKWTSGDPLARRALEDSSPLKRVGSPGEIADAVLWLLSSQSSFLTGQAISVDGGSTAGVQAGGIATEGSE